MRRLLDRLRHETRFASHIARRDLPRQLAAFALIAGVCWHVGARTEVVVLTGLILLNATADLLLDRLLPAQAARIRPAHLVAIWLSCVGGVVIYLWPAILLAGQPSVALMLVGFIWLFGVFVYVSNTYSALPVYNWSVMLPAFAMSGGVFWSVADQDFAPSALLDWWLAAASMVIYAVNTFETMVKQKDTQAQLDAARDAAQRRLAALEHMTRHDPLTGLLTRAAFDEGMTRMLSRQREGWHVGVLLIDLDGFKPINDTYSHEAGDAVLRAVAARLSDLAATGGIVARLGGDEFVLATDSLRSERAAVWLAEQALREIRKPIPWREKSLAISASIGIGLSGQAGQTVSDICAAADQAMYRAKGSGARIVSFRPEVFPRRLTLEDRNALSEALRSGQIQPHYQPKVRLDTGAIVGLEALARWSHPTRGLLLPADFLPQLNELGLQGDFMTVLTGQVLVDIATLVDEGLDPGCVSVNLPEVALATESGRADLHRLITLNASAARHITLEITEDMFIARAGASIQAGISSFRAAGLRVALDDFGTGFASFQHLRQLEFDELKIAPGFVADLGRDPVADVLVRGFLDIARGLKVDVIAEGVETEEQRRLLIGMGCTLAQGHLFGRAQPLAETRLRLTAEATRPIPLSRAPEPEVQPESPRATG